MSLSFIIYHRNRINFIIIFLYLCIQIFIIWRFNSIHNVFHVSSVRLNLSNLILFNLVLLNLGLDFLILDLESLSLDLDLHNLDFLTKDVLNLISLILKLNSLIFKLFFTYTFFITQLLFRINLKFGLQIFFVFI